MLLIRKDDLSWAYSDKEKAKWFADYDEKVIKINDNELEKDILRSPDQSLTTSDPIKHCSLKEIKKIIQEEQNTKNVVRFDQVTDVFWELPSKGRG